MLGLKRKILWFAKQCIRYMPVTLYYTYSLLKKESANTWAGFLWWIGEPLIYCFIYYFLFAVIFDAKTENYIVFLLVGLLHWRWLAMCLSSTTTSIMGNSGLLRQMDIPKAIFPVQAILLQSYKFLVAIVILYTLISVAGIPSFNTLYLFPLVFSCGALLMTGVGLILSITTPIVPDIRNIIRPCMRGLLFLSGVIYTADRIPQELLPIYYLNPLAILIESFRDVLLFGNMPDFSRLSYVVLLGTVLCAVGFVLHWRFNRIIPRYLR